MHRSAIVRKTLSLLFVFALSTIPAWAAKIETWRQDTTSAFSKGKKERVVISDNGRVRLAREVKATSAIDAARIWDLARTKAGVLYAATGDAGKVFRREAADGPWSVVYDATDTQALALAVTIEGKVFVGIGPSGQVVELTDAKQPVERIDADVQYIWDLAADVEGSLYAATGPNGQLWKRSSAGKWSKILDSKHPHLLCVVVGSDGTVFTGSDGEGLIYRVSRDGKTSVVYDAPQNEIRSLSLAADGSLYAGTAAAEPGGGPSGPSRGVALRPETYPERPLDMYITRVSFPFAESSQSKGSAPTSQPGTARPKPTAAGENAVYRIGPDGAAREVFRARALMNTMAWQDDRLLIGTGPEGQIYELRDGGRESAPVARLDHGQVLALLPMPSGEILIGAADPGSVLSLGSTYVGAGTLTSDVHDAKLISRFGSLTWRAERPARTSVSVQMRTGNVGEPDETWSAWSPPQVESNSPSADAPSARFAQYRATLTTDDPAVSPELRSVLLRYQTLNLAPELTKVDVPDVSDGDGSTRPTQITLRWDAADPNGDDLSYQLHIRKENWPDWVRLGDRPLTEKTFAWDTTATPAGIYRVRVTASDRPSNPPQEALSRELVSEPFLVDHQPPKVSVATAGKGVTATLEDSLSRLVKAAYALDGGEWVPVFPSDGLFDSLTEKLTISLPDLKPGVHVIMVRTTDAAGNTGAGDAVFESR